MHGLGSVPMVTASSPCFPVPVSFPSLTARHSEVRGSGYVFRATDAGLRLQVVVQLLRDREDVELNVAGGEIPTSDPHFMAGHQG